MLLSLLLSSRLSLQSRNKRAVSKPRFASLFHSSEGLQEQLLAVIRGNSSPMARKPSGRYQVDGTLLHESLIVTDRRHHAACTIRQAKIGGISDLLIHV